MMVQIYIDPADAVRAGRSTSGPCTVNMTDQDLAGMAREERGALADMMAVVGRPFGLGQAGPLPTTAGPTEPTVAEVVRVVRTRLAAEAQRQAAEAQRQADEARYQAGKKAAELEAMIDSIKRLDPADSRYVETQGDTMYVSWGSDVQRSTVDAATWACLVEVAGRCAAARAVKAQAAAVVAAARTAEIAAVLARADTVPVAGGKRGDCGALCGPDGGRLISASTADIDAPLREAIGDRLSEIKRHFSTALAAWVVEHGSDGQRARQEAGVLGEDEALGALRDALFADVEAPRYVRLDADDVPHDETCPDASPSYDVDDASATYPLTDGEFAAVAAIRQAAPQGATVTPRVHLGWCTDDQCNAGSVRRASALVALVWHGRVLSREYVLVT